MNRAVRRALQMPKFKGRIQVIWWSCGHICVRDSLTGKAKIIDLNKGKENDQKIIKKTA